MFTNVGYEIYVEFNKGKLFYNLRDYFEFHNENKFYLPVVLVIV